MNLYRFEHRVIIRTYVRSCLPVGSNNPSEHQGQLYNTMVYNRLGNGNNLNCQHNDKSETVGYWLTTLDKYIH